MTSTSLPYGGLLRRGDVPRPQQFGSGRDVEVSFPQQSGSGRDVDVPSPQQSGQVRAVTGGSVLHGKLIQRSVRRQT
ncbi:hypothetical protein FB458_2967 [Lapillicoccus jejuensis]|uniref:Uncharacterized protein n=1 Tax=Lapillicoccus jejuensis TaxID=402171 RepID=A0A542E3D1_9MICO|nr:hypothetical protein FB458_2967 [Lapillicoccus jejuensis]